MELERKLSQWFLYRNPTPSTLEIWTEGESVGYYCEVNEFYAGKPVFFWPKPEYIAFCHGAKIGHKDDFEDMLKAVKMLARWKASHIEKKG